MINGPSARASPRWSPDSHLSVGEPAMSARNAQTATSDDYHVTTPWLGPITSGDRSRASAHCNPREEGSDMNRGVRALLAALLVIAVIGLALATFVANVR